MSEVIKINTVTASVQIVTTGTQGPAGPKGEQGVQGPIGEVDPTVIENLQNQITDVQTLAQTNDLKIGTKADQVDLETAEQQIELNRLAILTKADIAALAMLAQLVDTKADQAYVNQQIVNLVGSAPEALNTVYELAAAIQDNAGIIDTLNQSVANRVRFDVATQALTETQKQNARTNIGAESLGTAATLVAAITAASIGAATAAQGTKADTALQSGDVAPVALSGLFNSLVGQNKMFDVVFGAYALGSNTAVVATDTLGQMLGKLQAQINAKKVTWVKANTVGAVHPNFDLSNLEFARLDDLLYMRGSIKVLSTTSADVTILNITNNSYKIKRLIPSNISSKVDTAALGFVGLGGTSFAVRLRVTNNCIDAATALSSSQVLDTFNTATQSDIHYSIYPTCLGELVIK
jgi:hypothetical protein